MIFFSRAILFTLCILFIQSTSARALDIQNIRFGAHSDKTRIVLELDQKTEFRSFTLPTEGKKPYRIVVDFPDFDWKAGVIKRPAKTDIIDVRSGVLNAGMKRLVIDLKNPAKIQKAFLLPAAGKKPHRLVIDYTSITPNEFAKIKSKPIGSLPDTSGDIKHLIISQNNLKTKPPVPQKTKLQKPVKTANLSKTSTIIPTKKPPYINTPKAPIKNTQKTTKTPLYKPLVVIDAGHGGNDPGAIGAEKQREKHVTLSAAKTLKSTLEKTGRYRAYLTRSNDKYIKLSKRVSIARHKNADLFISLHADSIEKSSVRGASIYTLSNKSSDAQTAKLAKRENQSDLIAGVDLSHEDKDVANILLDLTMRDTMNQSKFFANTIVEDIRNQGIKILPRPHRYAGFAVLKAPDVPSVLVEMGFMSNKSEARLLTTKSYQQKIATALTNSVDSYFQKVAKNNQ